MKKIYKLTVLLLIVLWVPFSLSAVEPFFQEEGKAIKGYDPVSYFSGKPQKGNKAYVFHWEGVDWYFVDEKNLKMFKENPESFVPQYGGYCAWAVSKGYTAPIDPHAWTIFRDKLYLNYNLSIRKRWSKDISDHVKSGDKNWPKLRDSEKN